MVKLLEEKKKKEGLEEKAVKEDDEDGDIDTREKGRASKERKVNGPKK